VRGFWGAVEMSLSDSITDIIRIIDIIQIIDINRTINIRQVNNWDHRQLEAQHVVSLFTLGVSSTLAAVRLLAQEPDLKCLR